MKNYKDKANHKKSKAEGQLLSDHQAEQALITNLAKNFQPNSALEIALRADDLATVEYLLTQQDDQIEHLSDEVLWEKRDTIKHVIEKYILNFSQDLIELENEFVQWDNEFTTVKTYQPDLYNKHDYHWEKLEIIEDLYEQYNVSLASFRNKIAKLSKLYFKDSTLINLINTHMDAYIYPFNLKVLVLSSENYH